MACGILGHIWKILNLIVVAFRLIECFTRYFRHPFISDTEFCSVIERELSARVCQ